eukprot:4628608-Amphidinium_carterae.1
MTKNQLAHGVVGVIANPQQRPFRSLVLFHQVFLQLLSFSDYSTAYFDMESITGVSVALLCFSRLPRLRLRLLPLRRYISMTNRPCLCSSGGQATLAQEKAAAVVLDRLASTM